MLPTLGHFVKRGETFIKELEKAVAKTVQSTQLLTALAVAVSPDQIPQSGFPRLLELLLALQRPPVAPSWLVEYHRQRLESEVTNALPLRRLLQLASSQSFLAYLIGEGRAPVCEQPLAGFCLVTQLLLQWPAELNGSGLEGEVERLRGQLQQPAAASERFGPYNVFFVFVLEGFNVNFQGG